MDDRERLPSELLGPVPRSGGSECARVAARIRDWRFRQDTADDVAAARSATSEYGDDSELKRVLAKIDRQIDDLECGAERDVALTGVVLPWRLTRLGDLRARRQHLRSLAAARFAPSPI